MTNAFEGLTTSVVAGIRNRRSLMAGIGKQRGARREHVLAQLKQAREHLHGETARLLTEFSKKDQERAEAVGRLFDQANRLCEEAGKMVSRFHQGSAERAAGFQRLLASAKAARNGHPLGTKPEAPAPGSGAPATERSHKGGPAKHNGKKRGRH